MSVNYHPLDFDALQKGDALAPETIEKITGFPIGTRRYELGVLQLRQRILRELEDRGRPVTVAVDGGCLRILTDEEAAEYNPHQFRVGFRKLLRAHRRALHVDASQLTAEQRAALERSIVVQSKMISAARATLPGLRRTVEHQGAAGRRR